MVILRSYASCQQVSDCQKERQILIPLYWKAGQINIAAFKIYVFMN